jgi:putative FmdB family regulatory protein
MPIYEYLCDRGHRFDVMQRMSDEALTSCEVCGAPVQRVLHPVAVHFKGSGFYNTDYGRGKGAKTDAAKDGAPASSDGGSSSSDSGSSSNGASAGSGKKPEKAATSD